MFKQYCFLIDEKRCGLDEVITNHCVDFIGFTYVLIRHLETVNGHNIVLCTLDISRHVSKNTADDLLFKTLNLRTVQIQIIKSVS